MAQRTGIEWTDMSANPIRAVRKSDGKRGHACVHASPGCIHCYSERWNGWRGTGLKFNVSALQQVDIILDQKELTRMRKVKAGNKVFVCDMTDLFGPFVPDAYIIEVFAAMCANQGATWQVLTKRPGRMAALLNDGDFWVRVALAMPSDDQVIPFPPPNIWIGTSVEDQPRADERIPYLLRVPARVRFLSCEPLLGPLDLSEWLGDKYGANQCRRCGISSDRDGGTFDRSVWSDMADSGAAGQQVDRGNANNTLSAAQGRARQRVVFDDTGNDQQEAHVCTSAPPDLASFQWPYPAEYNDQPQERQQKGQPPRESGVGDILRTSDSRDSCSETRKRSARREERDGKTDRCPSCGNPHSSGEWYQAESDRDRVRGNLSNDQQNRSGAAQGGLSWLIVGGESGHGARPMHPDWARSLRDQAQAAGVAFFMKQMGGSRDKGGSPDSIPEDLRIREFPEASYAAG